METSKPAAVPWRARMPWFQIWLPALLLFYVVFNGARHMEAAYRLMNTGIPSSYNTWVLQTASMLHGWLWFSAAFSLLVLAHASWRLSPQWSAGVRWLSRMLCVLR